MNYFSLALASPGLPIVGRCPRRVRQDPQAAAGVESLVAGGASFLPLACPAISLTSLDIFASLCHAGNGSVAALPPASLVHGHWGFLGWRWCSRRAQRLGRMERSVCGAADGMHSAVESEAISRGERRPPGVPSAAAGTATQGHFPKRPIDAAAAAAMPELTRI